MFKQSCRIYTSLSEGGKTLPICGGSEGIVGSSDAVMGELSEVNGAVVGDSPAHDAAAFSATVAAAHYKAAASSSSARAMFNLGFLYQFGIGLDQDFPLAKRYYDSARVNDKEADLPGKVALVGLSFHESVVSWLEWWRNLKMPNPKGWLRELDVEVIKGVAVNFRESCQQNLTRRYRNTFDAAKLLLNGVKKMFYRPSKEASSSDASARKNPRKVPQTFVQILQFHLMTLNFFVILVLCFLLTATIGFRKFQIDRRNREREIWDEQYGTGNDN